MKKAGELCKDKSMKGKLRNKIALQGAIYTSWALHKTTSFNWRQKRFKLKPGHCTRTILLGVMFSNQ